METKFNFKSAICTSREQSERLLALGLKKETADMALVPLMEWDDCTSQEYFTGIYTARAKEDAERYGLDYIPAWSLHRLWCLLPHSITIVTHFGQYKAGLDLTMDSYQNVSYLEGADEPCYDMSFFANDAYESICKAIEWLIKEGYFNKKYLEE
jgi:hypothetical protein